MTLPTNHKALRIERGEEPQDDLEREYMSLLKGESQHPTVSYAKDIYENEYKCEVLEAFLLSRASDQDIEKCIKVPQAVIYAYRQLFFDLATFRDELDIEDYAHNYAESDFGKELKICAITLGFDYMQYRFSRGKQSDINIVDALQNMIETGFILSKATRLNPLDSNAAREARQWMLSAIKGMESFTKVKPAFEQTADDFLIALETIDKTTNELKNSQIVKADLAH